MIASTDPLPHLDYEAFARDLDALRAEALHGLGPDDHAHLRRMARWGRLCELVGYGTACLAPNPLSMLGISLGSMARWCIVAHHISHGAMDRIEGVPETFTSRGFAKGRRRLVDWLDWMHPDAWHYEHDVLHHYHTNEATDPDVVEQNVAPVREAHVPRVLKYAALAWYACTWKFTYYAPNTFQVLRRAEEARAQGRPVSVEGIANPESVYAAFNPLRASGRHFWRACVLPYALVRFVALPAMFLPLGPWATFSVWVNSLGAELLTNVHTFAVITPNHAGDDMHRFERGVKDRAEFYVRQVLASVNMTTGGDLNDFLHGFLNYQIEHHLWPDLPPSVYQRLQPKVKEVCAHHGVPYVQQPLTQRLAQLAGIFVGARTMLRSHTRSRRERHAAA
jgi:fatty acid desaturase